MTFDSRNAWVILIREPGPDAKPRQEIFVSKGWKRVASCEVEEISISPGRKAMLCARMAENPAIWSKRW